MEHILMLDPAHPVGLYHDAHGRAATTPGELEGPEREIDLVAASSVLQYGAIVPPLAPWRGVRRFFPGYCYEGLEKTAPIELELPAPEKLPTDASGQADEVGRQLDVVLRRLLHGKPDPVVLFSGGVDSGLLAARLAEHGRSDTLLVNYSTGGDDSESRLAEAMARHLGLPFKRVVRDRDPIVCLEEPGTIYPVPFGDLATPLMWELAHAVTDTVEDDDRPILDGTGADGAFGMVGKIARWKKLLSLPLTVRQLASRLYENGVWYRGGRVEYYLRVLRRSAQLPMVQAVVAQNPLAGILYNGSHATEISHYLKDWVTGWTPDSLRAQVIASDLALTCAGVFAQKGHCILEDAGLDAHYPFLSNQMVAFSLAASEAWEMSEPKAPLKRCLARHVPRNMVYRSKSAFVDPDASVFYHPTFIDYLRHAADDSGPISSILIRENIQTACQLLDRGAELPAQTRNCLWAIVFLDRWYRTAE